MSELLKTELGERYLRRSAFFWKKAADSTFAELQKKARSGSWENVTWDWAGLGITDEARLIAEQQAFVPSEIFAHPAIIEKNPELLDYYRLLACLSQKGLQQILPKKQSKGDRLANSCRTLNATISHLLKLASKINRDTMLGSIYAEAGSEWQGTWVNLIGQSSEKALKIILLDFAKTKGLLPPSDKEPGKKVILKSGLTIHFGSEPDVSFRSASGELLCVIEVKGSADKAGAQTRLGETKKSFTKAKLENPRCHTIFLPSIQTDAVREQLKTERDIDQVFNLIDIFRDPVEQGNFLLELFKFRLREAIY